MRKGWITSQNDTAPKHWPSPSTVTSSWITSQNDTAPKLLPYPHRYHTSWITSQNDTAPKHVIESVASLQVGLPVRTTLLQNMGANVA